MRADDFDALHQAASDPLIWAQHSVPDRHERAVFRRFFDGALACGGGLVAQDSATGRLIGSSRYYEWNAADRSVVIGYSFLERAQWGTGTNREMKSLMIVVFFVLRKEKNPEGVLKNLWPQAWPVFGPWPRYSKPRYSK